VILTVDLDVTEIDPQPGLLAAGMTVLLDDDVPIVILVVTEQRRSGESHGDDGHDD
jgi:hypothetical protein